MKVYLVTLFNDQYQPFLTWVFSTNELAEGFKKGRLVASPDEDIDIKEIVVDVEVK